MGKYNLKMIFEATKHKWNENIWCHLVSLNSVIITVQWTRSSYEVSTLFQNLEYSVFNTQKIWKKDSNRAAINSRIDDYINSISQETCNKSHDIFHTKCRALDERLYASLPMDWTQHNTKLGRVNIRSLRAMTWTLSIRYIETMSTSTYGIARMSMHFCIAEDCIDCIDHSCSHHTTRIKLKRTRIKWTKTYENSISKFSNRCVFIYHNF